MGRDTDFDFGANLGFPTDVNPTTGEIVACMGRVKCVHCGKIYGLCSVVETQLTQEENTIMLPSAGGSNQSSGGGRQQTQRSGLTYISEKDLTRDKQIARIIAARENTDVVKEGQQRFSDVVVKIAFKGQMRLYGLKLNNPNLAMLQEAFTQDENKWPDREFYLFLEIEEFTERARIRVEPIEKKTAKTAKKS